MLPYWGQEVKEPKSVKDGNCGLYRPQVICSSQGLFQHFLVSGFGEQREWAVVSPCILIFRKALVSELQLYSWLTRGWCLTGCLIIEGLVLCGPEQYGLTSLALPSSYVSVHACMHTHTHTHTHTQSLYFPGVLPTITRGFSMVYCPKRVDAEVHVRTSSQAVFLPQVEV